MTLAEGVVGAKMRADWLRHLAPLSGQPVWATRPVTALCGWTGMAVGCDFDARTGQRTGDGGPTFRRSCQRCERIASRDGWGFVDA